MKKIILRADVPSSSEERKNIVLKGLESGITDFILRRTDSEFESLGIMNVFYEPEFIKIDSAASEKTAMGSENDVFIELCGDWKIIPLENIIASSSEKKHVYCIARTEEQANTYLNALETGVDGIVIDDISIIGNISSAGTAELTEVVVRSVKPVGMGDRVCVDTCSMMTSDEGMLIGSHSNCLLLVQSESEDSEYVSSRPFRVNAGAVHGYTLVPDGTRYLSEIASGTEVVICDRNGRTRTSVVGRSKIESRPLIMVSVLFDGREYNVILQNAETVRLMKKTGSASVTELKVGDAILAHISSGGRHFGMKIDETVQEK